MMGNVPDEDTFLSFRKRHNATKMLITEAVTNGDTPRHNQKVADYPGYVTPLAQPRHQIVRGWQKISPQKKRPDSKNAIRGAHFEFNSWPKLRHTIR